MTAAADVIAPTGEGLAARRALRSARIRGVVFAIFGLLAFSFARDGFETPAVFKFWIDQQGGASSDPRDDRSGSCGSSRASRPGSSACCSSFAAPRSDGGRGCCSCWRRGSRPCWQKRSPASRRTSPGSSAEAWSWPSRSAWVRWPASCPSGVACSTSRSRARCSSVPWSPRSRPASPSSPPAARRSGRWSVSSPRCSPAGCSASCWPGSASGTRSTRSSPAR